MSTTNAAVPMSKQDQIKAMRRALAPKIGDILTAEAVLLDAQAAASKSIGDLITKSANPQHWITLGKGTPDENKILVTFRKIGEYMGDPSGNPITPTVAEDGTSTYPAGSKPFPLYGMKQTDGPDAD